MLELSRDKALNFWFYNVAISAQHCSINQLEFAERASFHEILLAILTLVQNQIHLILLSPFQNLLRKDKSYLKTP